MLHLEKIAVPADYTMSRFRDPNRLVTQDWRGTRDIQQSLTFSVIKGHSPPPPKKLKILSQATRIEAWACETYDKVK